MGNIPAGFTPAFRAWLWTAPFVAALAFMAVPTRASVTFTNSAVGNDAGETNSATATFSLSVSGTTTDLVVTLTNTAKYKPNDPPDILTSVAFSLTGDPTLTPVSALLSNGSQIVENGSTVSDPGGAVGASFCYTSSLSGGPAGANEGIGSSGYWGFGSNNTFPGATVPGDSPTPDGVGGGLTTAVDDGSKYNGGLKNRPFIQDSAVFTLSCVPANLTLSSIANVSFGYGTAPDQVVAAIPEPSAVVLTTMGVLFLGLLNRKQR